MATVTIIADASFCPHTRAGGWGYWIASDRGKRGGGGELNSMFTTDNSRHAEMMALVNALHVARKAGLVQDGDEVLLQTDCTEAINALRAGQPKRITDPFRELCKNLVISYKHVKGHTNPNTHREARFTTNRMCDKRARFYMERVRERRRPTPCPFS